MTKPTQLWHRLRDWPWDEAQVPKPRAPHPEPTMRATVGDWLTEFGITTYPQAPQSWRLIQRLAEGYGMNAATGRPLRRPTRSLVLAYLHLGTAQGATAILHYKPGAKKDGSGSWGFVQGYRWDFCTCEHDRNHLTADLLREASADEIKKLLTEGTACATTPAEDTGTSPDPKASATCNEN